MNKDLGKNTANAKQDSASTEKSPWDALVLNSEGPNKKKENAHLNATRKEDYLRSQQGERETEYETRLDLLTEDMDKKVAAGLKSREEANKELEDYMDEQIKKLDKQRQEFFREKSLRRAEEIFKSNLLSDDQRQKIVDVYGQIIARRPQKTDEIAGNNDEDKDAAIIQTDDSGADLYSDDSGKAKIVKASWLTGKGRSAVVRRQTGSQPVLQPADQTGQASGEPAPAPAQTADGQPAQPVTKGNNGNGKGNNATPAPQTSGNKPKDPKAAPATDPKAVDPKAATGNKNKKDAQPANSEAVQIIIAQKAKENAEKQAAIEAKREKLKALMNKNPLIGINVDFSDDRAKLVKERKDAIYDAEKSEAGFFKRVRMDIFKEHYLKKYAKEIESGKRKIMIDGKEMTLDEALESRAKGAINRFIDSVVENDISRVHEAEGESLNYDKNATKAISNVIKDYAQKRGTTASEAVFNKLLRTKLENNSKLNANLMNQANNYYKIAEDAIKIRETYKGVVSLDEVLTTFKVYNAKVSEDYSPERRAVNDEIIAEMRHRNCKHFVTGEGFVIAYDEISSVDKAFEEWKKVQQAIKEAAQKKQAPANPDPKAAAGANPAADPAAAKAQQGKTANPEAKPVVDYDAYKSAIGEKGVEFLKPDPKASLIDEKLQKDFTNWYNSLDEDGKKKAKAVADSIPERGLEDGGGRNYKELIAFMQWNSAN